MTVLSGYNPGNPAADFDRAQLLARMQAFYQKQATKKVQAVSDGYQQKINSVNLTADRWRDLRTEIQDARSVISGNLGRARAIKERLDDMIRAVNKAEQNAGEVTGTAIYAASFDAYLRGLDDTAVNSSDKLNLLGSARQEMSYRVGINGTTNTVNSAYIGSDYYIVDSEGKYWDLDRKAKILKRYDVYPDEPTGTSGNFEHGLRLDSLNGTDIAFTINPDTADPQSFTGTLHRKGLELLDSWAYEKLATADGRARALADLKDAKTAVDLEIRRYQMVRTTSDYYEKIAGEAIKGLRKKTDRHMIDRAIEIQTLQDELARDFQMAQSSVVRSIAMQNQYANLLNPLFSNRFAKSLIDIWA